MMFATIDYPGCCGDKTKSDEIASKWSQLMSSAGIDQQTYVVSNDTILFSSNIGTSSHEIKEFVLKQPECVAVEWNQMRTPGPAETPEWKARKAKAEEEKNKKKKEEKEKAAEEKRKKMAKKRRKAAKKTAGY